MDGNDLVSAAKKGEKGHRDRAWRREKMKVMKKIQEVEGWREEDVAADGEEEGEEEE